MIIITTTSRTAEATLRGCGVFSPNAAATEDHPHLTTIRDIVVTQFRDAVHRRPAGVNLITQSSRCQGGQRTRSRSRLCRRSPIAYSPRRFVSALRRSRVPSDRADGDTARRRAPSKFRAVSRTFRSRAVVRTRSDDGRTARDTESTSSPSVLPAWPRSRVIINLARTLGQRPFFLHSTAFESRVVIRS